MAAGRRRAGLRVQEQRQTYGPDAEGRTLVLLDGRDVPVFESHGPAVWVRHPIVGRSTLVRVDPLRGPRTRGTSQWAGGWSDYQATGVATLSLRLTLDVQAAASGVALTLTVRNDGGEAVTLDAISPIHCSGGITGSLEFDEPVAARTGGSLVGWTAWLHGRQMTSASLSHRFGCGERHADFPPSFVRQDPDDRSLSWTSHGMVVLSKIGSRTCLLLGFVTQGRQFTDIVWDTSEDEDGDEPLVQYLFARCQLEGQVLAPGESVVSETLLIALGDDPVELADLYARETARRMKARVPKETPSGWCSWYFFYNRVSERDVLDNLEALKAMPYKVDYAQIDDGFQAATGDWLTPNEKFPRGMQPVAEEIAAAGFRPGLWLAPFTLNRGSHLFKEHPEWMLHDAEGNVILQDIWLGPCAGLDCTHPGAQEWLRNLIRTVVRDWGYSFLKLDALFTACFPDARHHVANTTTAANLRRGLEIVREAAGDDTFILGCSCPFGPAIGLVDAMRVGADVEARWFNDEQPTQPSAKHAMRLSLQRNWMHRRFWLNDPDCLTVRDNSSPAVPGSLTLEEARFLATGIALSGGLGVLSDDLATLRPERREVALRVLPPTGRAARPVDLIGRETPAVWRLPLGRGRLAVAVLNWDDEPMDAAVTWQELGLTGPYFAREQWTGAILGRLDGAVRLPAVPAHAARVVLLDPRRPPRATPHLLPVRGRN